MSAMPGRGYAVGLIKVIYPFDIRLSKNQMWKRGKWGGVYLACADQMAEISNIIKSRVQPGDFIPGVKTHISLKVYKPNNRSDAANFLDTILDATQIGIGVNDRFFSGSFDWEIDKLNPRFEITISQEVICKP